MQEIREYVKGRLGEKEEAVVHEKYGADEDEYIHNFLLSHFKETSEAGMCKFCKQKTVYVHLRQDRSADEGMTAHAVCSNQKCMRKWVMY